MRTAQIGPDLRLRTEGTRLHKNDHGIMKFERFERLSHQEVYNRCVICRFK